MASIKDVTEDFFAACEAGKGWAVCRAYCTPDATFSSQAGECGVKSFAVDDERKNVCAGMELAAQAQSGAGASRSGAAGPFHPGRRSLLRRTAGPYIGS